MINQKFSCYKQERFMNKTIFLLICLIALSSTLKVHFQALPKSQQEEDPTPDALSAYGRLLDFITKDQDLGRALTSGQEPPESQTMKLVAFMIDDPFFQNQLIKAVSSNEGNKWIGDLSKQAQVRFLKIITSISPREYDDDNKMNEVISKLRDDSEIGPALKKKFGDDLNSSIVTSSGSNLGSSVNKHLMMVADDI